MISLDSSVIADSKEEAQIALDKIIQSSDKPVIFDADTLISLVRKEINIFKEKNYSIAGFGNRWLFYKRSLSRFVGEYLISNMMFRLSDILTHRKYIGLQSIIDSKRNGYYHQYNIFLSTIDYLTKEYKEEFISIIDDDFYQIAFVTGSLYFFENRGKEKLDRLEKLKKSDREKFEILKISLATDLKYDDDAKIIGIADWIINQEIKHEYLSFLKENYFLRLDDILLKEFQDIFPPEDYNGSIRTDFNFSVIDQILEREILEV